MRCHQDLTHRIGLKPTDQAYQVLGQMVNYCSVLRAPWLVLETPASYVFSDESIDDASRLFESTNLRGVRLAWEPRSQVPPKAQKMMQKHNIVHAADLSRQTPLFPSDAIYTRLFGKGEHNIYQFSDAELKQIDQKIQSLKVKSVSLSYHGVRMYTDAARFVQYERTGAFPSITGLTGLASAKAILAEDTKFPIGKEALVKEQGWKVFDASANERIHLSEWLERLPEKTYSNLAEVAAALEATQS